MNQPLRQPTASAASASQSSGLGGREAPAGTGAGAGTGSVSSARGGGSSTRETFDTFELAIVLSQYDIGIIEAIQEFPRGSRRAPKVLIRAEQGMYLLKRRARGKDDPFKVAFCHHLQLYLAERQFPIPHLIGTRRDNNSMLQFKGRIYELFEFIKGTSYDNSIEATADSGKVLGLFHKLLRDHEPDYEPPRGSYHASRSVANSLESIPQTLSRLDPEYERYAETTGKLVEKLGHAYSEAAHRANELGLGDWPMQIVHSDWHPGNMLFRGPRVVAVIDYDAARLQQRVTDIANGALQFSILGGGDDPAAWPDDIDLHRFRAFLQAYDQVPGCMISKAELQTVPWLMIEALIAEAAIPIAATGTFGRMEGMGILEMVLRKVQWLKGNAERLSQVLDDQK